MGLGLKRSAALQPCPSARPGVQGQGRLDAEGDHPPAGARKTRVYTRLALMSSCKNSSTARQTGDTAPARHRSIGALPLPARGREPLAIIK